MSAVIQYAVCRDARHAKAAGTYIVHDPLEIDSSDQRSSIVRGCPKVLETYSLEMVMEHPKTHVKKCVVVWFLRLQSTCFFEPSKLMQKSIRKHIFLHRPKP